MASSAFKDYVLSGRFNKVASEAVANAIAATKARGLPVEGYANTEAKRVSAVHARAAFVAPKKPSKRAA